MIRALRAASGYAEKIPALQGRVFEFEQGLTVLFGQNGSGKSTLLKLLAMHSACLRPGWSTWSTDYMRINFGKPRPPFPERFGMPGLNGQVDWDGTPTYYSVGTPARGQAAFEEAMEKGGDAADDVFRRILAPVSSGQDRIFWLNDRLEQEIARAPSLARDASFYVYGHGLLRAANVNSVWADGIHEFADYVASLPRTGPVTVLLDEPDGHLSLPNQDKLWRQFLPRLAEGRQVIVASHSPFALRMPRILDLEPGYSERCRQTLRALGAV